MRMPANIRNTFITIISRYFPKNNTNHQYLKMFPLFDPQKLYQILV